MKKSIQALNFYKQIMRRWTATCPIASSCISTTSSRGGSSVYSPSITILTRCQVSARSTPTRFNIFSWIIKKYLLLFTCNFKFQKIFYEEILKRSPRRELLNEYACHLVKYHPQLKQEVLVKLQFLNRQWKFIEYSIISKHYFNQDITKGNF